MRRTERSWTEALDFMNQLLAEFPGNPPADVIRLREALAVKSAKSMDESERIRIEKRIATYSNSLAKK
jgi:hypothetical protein